MAESDSCCEVCGRALCIGGHKRTGICQRCLAAGAEFARSWMAALRGEGLTSVEIAEVVGTSEHAVRSRLSERRRQANLRPAPPSPAP